MGRTFSTKLGEDGHVQVIGRKPEGKRSLARPRPKNLYNIKMDRWILERQNGVVWTGFVWLRTGTSGELL
jgi:hypothetical protein